MCCRCGQRQWAASAAWTAHSRHPALRASICDGLGRVATRLHTGWALTQSLQQAAGLCMRTARGTAAIQRATPAAAAVAATGLVPGWRCSCCDMLVLAMLLAAAVHVCCAHASGSLVYGCHQSPTQIAAAWSETQRQRCCQNMAMVPIASTANAAAARCRRTMSPDGGQKCTTAPRPPTAAISVHQQREVCTPTLL